jgi:hypothetical protein
MLNDSTRERHDPKVGRHVHSNPVDETLYHRELGPGEQSPPRSQERTKFKQLAP